MDISYEDSQLILRALEGHSTRMMKIAESENMIGHTLQANVAAQESRDARALADRFVANGVRMA